MKQNANKNTGKNNRNGKNTKATVRANRAKRSANAAAPVVKEPMPRAKKGFIALVALLCVFAISLASVGTVLLVDMFSAVKYPSIYEKIDLSQYVHNIVKDDYIGVDIDLSPYYAEPYTIEDMDDHLKMLALENRKTVALSQMTSTIGYGDDVAYFILAAYDANGNLVCEDDFASYNYSSAGSMTVGTELFGADFDEKLIALGISPDDTEVRVRYNGTVDADDVIALSYKIYANTKNDTTKDDPAERYSWDSTASKSLNAGRVDLASYDKAIAEAVVANCKALRQPFECILENYDIDGNGTIESKEKAVKIEATVDFAVVLETVQKVTFTIPEGYFDKEKADYIVLNGKQVTFDMVFTRMDDYDVPAINAAFIKDTLKFETDKTSDAEVIEAFKAYKLEQLNVELQENMQKSYYATVYGMLTEPLFQKGCFGDKTAAATAKYPQEIINDAYQASYDEMQSIYYASGQSAAYTFEDFAIGYINSQTGMQAQSLSAALSYMAEQRIAQELFMFWVLKEAKIKITDEMLDAAYREYVDGLIESSSDPAIYNEEYFINLHGKDKLYTQARRTILVYRLVGDYLLQNNNVTYGS